MSMSPIVLGDARVSVDSINVPTGAIITLEAVIVQTGAIAEIVSIMMDSHNAYINDQLVNLISEIDCSTSGCATVQLPITVAESMECVMLTETGWNTESCKIVSNDHGVVTFTTYKNGLFTLVPGSSIATSNSIPLYIIISLVIFAALFVPFAVYFDKNSPYLSVANFSMSTDSRSDRNIKFPTESEVGEMRKESIFFSHLLIGLAKPRSSFNRSKRLLLLVANIILEIYLQNCLMNHTVLQPAYAGLVSVAITMIITAVVTIFLSGVGKAKNIIGIVLLGAMYITSIVGMFLTITSSGWLVAMLVGFAAEIFGAQTIIMIASRVLRINGH